MSKYHNDDTYASNPGKITLSASKWSYFWKAEPLAKRMLMTVFGARRRFREIVSEHLQSGDARAAVVVATNPLLVGAYTDELDCVVLLEFPPSLLRQYSLNPGDRLLTVNTYEQGQRIAEDLWFGEDAYDRYVNFYPIIADFLTDTAGALESAKAAIHEDEWKRCERVANELASRPDVKPRRGSPLASFTPAAGAGGSDVDGFAGQ